MTDTSKDYVAASSMEHDSLLDISNKAIKEKVVFQEENKASDVHYKYFYKGIKMDPYRIIDIYRISNSAHQHALKKLLRAGKSIKSLERDIDEVIMTLNRWKEMIKEDENE